MNDPDDFMNVENYDEIFLNNGDTYLGIVLNEDFNIRTSYAHINIKAKYIAAINFNVGAKNLKSIVTLNNNLFSGFIDEKEIDFRMPGGKDIKIRMETLKKISFMANNSSEELEDIGTYILLQNEDYFTGILQNKELDVLTPYAKIPIDLDQVISMNVSYPDHRLPRIKMKNGNKVRGLLSTEDFDIKLDLGTRVKIYKGLIDQIIFEDDLVPNSDGRLTMKKKKSSKDKNLALVKSGIFQMGSMKGNSNEKPVHSVTITYNYMMSKKLVTFEEYDLFCKETRREIPNDNGWGREKRPAMNVSWWDAIKYCNWLSSKDGLKFSYNKDGILIDKAGNPVEDPSNVEGYRLPTEAEWEFAARGGNESKETTYAGGNEVGEVGWYKFNSDNRTHEVAQKNPNELGIYDMSGNVREWCSDSYQPYARNSLTNVYISSGELKVLRGGCWSNIAGFLRITQRNSEIPDSASSLVGFRIVKTETTSAPQSIQIPKQKEIENKPDEDIDDTIEDIKDFDFKSLRR